MIIIISDSFYTGIDTFSLNGGKCVGFRDHNPMYQQIKTWIDIKNDQIIQDLTYDNTSMLKENIIENLTKLLDKKESPPKNATEKELKKWLKKNPREIVEILGKKISIGGLGLMPPPLDYKIMKYNKLLKIIDNCIEKNSPLHIKIESDEYQTFRLK